MKAHPNHLVWKMIAPEIKPEEFNAPYEMHTETLIRLSRARRMAKVPFRFVSDYRPPERNEAVGGAKRSAHMTNPCRAVDIRVHTSAERYAVVRAAILEGFNRIGIYPPTEHQRKYYGKNAGSIHLDDSPDHPQRVIWVSV